MSARITNKLPAFVKTVEGRAIRGMNDALTAGTAEAAGMTKQAVSECLKRVEDLRDDPAIDALVERVSRLISGRVE